MPALERLTVTRVVSTPDALDAASYPSDTIVMRTAPDEALVIGGGEVAVDDPHAICVDDTGWFGAWVPAEDADRFLRTECSWPRPADRPAFAQGMIAHLPVKLWLESARALFVVPHVSAQALQERMGA